MTLGKREATVNWHCVENWLWKGLWACRTAGCRVSELWMQHGDINCIIRCGWGLRFWDATCVGSAFRCAVGCVVRWINIHMSCWMCRALDQHSHVLLDVSCVGSAFTCPVGCFVRWISIQMSCWMRRALDQHSDILLDVRCPVGCVVRWISIQMSVGCVVRWISIQMSCWMFSCVGSAFRCLLDVSLCLTICTLHRSLEGTVHGV